MVRICDHVTRSNGSLFSFVVLFLSNYDPYRYIYMMITTKPWKWFTVFTTNILSYTLVLHPVHGHRLLSKWKVTKGISCCNPTGISRPALKISVLLEDPVPADPQRTAIQYINTVPPTTTFSTLPRHDITFKCGLIWHRGYNPPPKKVKQASHNTGLRCPRMASWACSPDSGLSRQMLRLAEKGKSKHN